MNWVIHEVKGDCAAVDNEEVEKEFADEDEEENDVEVNHDAANKEESADEGGITLT